MHTQIYNIYTFVTELIPKKTLNFTHQTHYIFFLKKENTKYSSKNMLNCIFVFYDENSINYM